MKLQNGRVALTLHELPAPVGARDSASAEPSLLLFHALGGSSNDWEREAVEWPGSVHALDFAGHGASGWIDGGGYTPETFVADADAALAALPGDVYIAGAGIGAYVALLLSGARAARIPAALLFPGSGYDGGGAEPDHDAPVLPVPAFTTAERAARAYDPLVATCQNDLRPFDYAEEFARAARQVLLATRPLPAPPWLEAVARSRHVRVVPADSEAAFRELVRASESELEVPA